jgi:hypothetical protein
MLEDALGLSLVRDAALALTAGLTVAELPQLPAAAVQRVIALGFSTADAVAAAVATQGPADLASASSSSSSSSNSAAVTARAAELLEWLCLHVDEGSLPEGFDPRGRMLDVVQPGAKQTVKRATTATTTTAGTAASTTAAAGATAAGAAVKQSKQAHKQPTATATRVTNGTSAAGGSAAVAAPARQLTALQRKLTQYGFSEAAVTAVAGSGSDWLTVATAAAALLSSTCTDSGSAVPALAWLTDNATSSSSNTNASSNNNNSNESWEDAAAADDELEALEAIFGQQVTRLPAPGGSSCVHTALQIDLGHIEGIGDSPQGDTPTAAEANTWLDVFLPGGGAYPGLADEPLALLRCAQLTSSSSSNTSCSTSSSAAALLAVQVALAAKVTALQGQCCVYDLVVWAQSDAPELLQQALQQQALQQQQTAPTVAAAPAAVAAADSNADTNSGSASSRRAVPLVHDPDASGAVWGDADDDVSDHVSDHVSDDTHSISSSSSSATTATTAATSTTASSSSSSSGSSRGQAQQRTGKQTVHRPGSVQPPRGVPAHERKRGRERIESSKEYAAMKRQRDCLPAAKARAELLAMVRASQVVLVAGETGCGKTTQVCDAPQL